MNAWDKIERQVNEQLDEHLLAHNAYVHWIGLRENTGNPLIGWENHGFMMFHIVLTNPLTYVYMHVFLDLCIVCIHTHNIHMHGIQHKCGNH
jgi:hypothetical protein